MSCNLAVNTLFTRQASPATVPLGLACAIFAMLMTGILLLGMLRREKTGPARIGFESVIVLGLYVGSVVLVLL